MQIETKFLRLFREVTIGDHIDGWRVLDWRFGQAPGLFRGYGGKAKAIRPDAIGPARFPGARLIEANRHHPRGILSAAALFIGPKECKTGTWRNNPRKCPAGSSARRRDRIGMFRSLARLGLPTSTPGGETRRRYRSEDRERTIGAG